ncbi:MAG: SAM-dependent methyltransferase [Simkaniaceae bacterium]|nr:SAM-dependent methyltransferase [Simkaniaceae bacterium]
MPLILLPNSIDDSQCPMNCFAPEVHAAVQSLHFLIAENEKNGRHYLMKFRKETFRNVPIHVVNEHTTLQQKKELMQEIQKGGNWGLISDAGLPCLADPGFDLVKRCHQLHIPVKAYPGPSAIVQALMLSGLSSQSFAFHGYLARELEPLRRKLLEMEKSSKTLSQTQLFIETPYRTVSLLKTLVETLSPEVELAVVFNVGSEKEGVMLHKVGEWRQQPLPDLGKVPAVFLFTACSACDRSR